MHPFMKHTVVSILFLIFSISFSPAQSKYHNYNEMTDEISYLVASKSDIASIKSIAQTTEKRNIWAVTIGGRDADNRPAVLIVGGIEGDRIISSELTLQLIKHLIQNYGKIDSITSLIKNTTFYIIPRMNPDAMETFFAKTRYERKINARPTDDDKDGTIDEDGYEDINGDGLITMMRIKDNNGEYFPHPDDNRIMKKVDKSKGELGSYLLLTEGIDNDKDEKWNEDGPGGVDLNRNFPHNYIFFGNGSGPYQISEEETKALTDFCFSHQNIVLVFTYSSNDNLINPWKKDPSLRSSAQDMRFSNWRRRMEEGEDYSPRPINSVMEEDEKYYGYISKQFHEITKIKSGPAPQKGEGAFSEWVYYHYGRWSFAAPPWWIPDTEKNSDTSSRKIPELKIEKGFDDKPDEYAEQIKALKWFDNAGLKENFIHWKEIKHPDFIGKKVEVGGFRPFVFTNPPPESIQTISQKFNTFITWLATKLPKIVISNVKVEPIEGKIFRITADIVNTGYFPTNSAMGSMVRWQRDVKVTLGMKKNQELINGYASTTINPVDGGNSKQELTWLIIGNRGETVTISAESPTTGIVTEKVELK